MFSGCPVTEEIEVGMHMQILQNTKTLTSWLCLDFYTADCLNYRFEVKQCSNENYHQYRICLWYTMLFASDEYANSANSF